MRPKRIVLGGVLVLAVFAACLCFFISRHGWRQPGLHANDGEAATPITPHTTNNSASVQQLPSERLRPPGLDERIWAKVLKDTDRLMSENSPLEFYARVLDQDGNPVAGAQLSLRVERYDRNLLLKASYGGETRERKDVVLTSDADGRFKLKQPEACNVNVLSLSKPGYLWKSNIYISYYNALVRLREKPEFADPLRGVVFHMWRQGKAEPLIPVGIWVSVGEDSTQRPVNFFNKAEVDFVDWRIHGRHVRSGNPTNRYDQQITIEAINGELMEAVGVHYPFVAPEAGYQPSFTFLYRPGDSSQSGEGWERRFYVKLRNGRVFGGFVIKFMPAPDIAFQIRGYLNPAGSRNLEPDPAKLIEDPNTIRALDLQTRSGSPN